MRLSGPIYERCLAWAGHRHAGRDPATGGAAGSVVFPIPPDVMLDPRLLAKPERCFRYSLIGTLASVLGGVLGYVLSACSLDALMPWIERTGKRETFDHISECTR
jgi:membrane protein YqaA with SNARE-associated domain